MHDIKMIRENPAAFDAAMARRGLSGISDAVLAIDTARRGAIADAESQQASSNAEAKAISVAFRSGNVEEAETLKVSAQRNKQNILGRKNLAKAKDAELHDMLMSLPNLIADDVPDGADEDDNVQIHTWGNPQKFDFDAKEHFEIAAVQGGMDFEVAAKLSGSRFVVMSGAVARVHRALAQFMLDTHIDKHDLRETNVPVLVREEMMYGTGQLPKFGEDSYKTTDGWWLIPTAEVPLTNIVNGEVLDAATLPRRYVAHTLCFRSEAGSAGRDTSGMLRQHQFEKVEMVSVCHPDVSGDEHNRMTKCAEAILEALNLAYRTVILCTGDLGAGMRKTHDIEVWLPGQNAYREISSISVAGDFQARRMNARFKPAGGGKPEFVHTLNGSGLAVGRCLIAVLENGQDADGSVTLPDVLHPYLGGKTTITSDGHLA